jgi:alginate O-acetyltransferase complex protein AlgJ
LEAFIYRLYATGFAGGLVESDDDELDAPSHSLKGVVVSRHFLAQRADARRAEVQPFHLFHLLSEDAFNRLPGTPEYAPGWNRTVVTSPVAIGLSVVFAIGLLVIPLADFMMGAWKDPWFAAVGGWLQVKSALTADGPWFNRIVNANRAALAGIKNFEVSLEDSSQVIGKIRPATLDGLLRFGAAGSEEAYIGKDGWLFYRPDVDALLRPDRASDDAARGVASFAADLADRGIRLIVVPVPGKASIHPEKLSPDGIVFEAPPVSSVLSKLPAKVASAWRQQRQSTPSVEPLVLDPTLLLWERKRANGEEQFLHTDSHWTPGAMHSVARLIADALSDVVRGRSGQNADVEPRDISAVGDTAQMLDLPSSSPFLSPQAVQIEEVCGADASSWQPDRKSPILILGDSYTNIYSMRELGWGESAGLAEQLSRRLGFDVDKLARNDAGARSAREMLAAEMARNPDWLESKKVVVWVMAAREFTRGDWSHVALKDKIPAKSEELFVVPPGPGVEVSANIAGFGQLPSAGDSPYADYLTAVHLTGLCDASSGQKLAHHALVYIFTMRDRQILRLPQLVEGHRVKLRLFNYAQKSKILDGLNRGDLEDLEIMMQEPNFAEWTGSVE